MGESRPDNPPADPSRPAASGAGLSPTMQAYSAYVNHAVGCATCHSAAAGPCMEGEALWEAYRQLRRDERAGLSMRQ